MKRRGNRDRREITRVRERRDKRMDSGKNKWRGQDDRKRPKRGD